MSEVKTNKISPATGTALTLGDSGDTFTVPSGANIVNSGTATGFGGGILVQQVHTQDGAVSTTTTTSPHDDTIPQNTEGGEFMTLAITPTSATNVLEIDVVIQWSHSVANQWGSLALFQDTTAGALAAANDHKYTGTGMIVTSFRHHMTSGTTSATTFKVRGGCNSAGTFTFNGQSAGRELGGVLASSITIKEFEV